MTRILKNCCLFLLLFHIGAAQALPIIGIRTNQSIFQKNAQLLVDVQLDNSGGDALDVDIYIAIFVFGDYYFFPAFQTSPAGMPFDMPADFNSGWVPILNVTLEGDEPLDAVWFAALTHSGGMDVIGSFGQAAFEYRPETAPDTATPNNTATWTPAEEPTEPESPTNTPDASESATMVAPSMTAPTGTATCTACETSSPSTTPATAPSTCPTSRPTSPPATSRTPFPSPSMEPTSKTSSNPTTSPTPLITSPAPTETAECTPPYGYYPTPIPEPGTLDIIDNGSYVAFPSVAKLDDGSLFLVYREGLAHVDQGGRITGQISTDGGLTWGQPFEVYDEPGIDDRDPSIMQTSAGTLLINFFQHDFGVLVLRSTDLGRSWTEQQPDTYPFEAAASTDNIIELHDGSLALPVYGWIYDRGTMPANAAGALRSLDDGVTWEWPVEIIATGYNSPSDVVNHILEPSIAQRADGRIYCVMRSSENSPNRIGPAFINWSDDNGETWTDVDTIDVFAFASDLLFTTSGDLYWAFRDLDMYAEDGMTGRTSLLLGTNADGSVDERFDPTTRRIIYERKMCDGAGWDCGYPSMIQLDQATLFMVYYTHLGLSIRGAFIGIGGDEAITGKTVRIR